MKRVILFTDFFPYSAGETFLETEIKYLSLYFEKIDIIPLTSYTALITRELPNNAYAHKPVLKNYKNKLELIFWGLFNFAPVFPFIKEFINKGVWKNKKHIYSLLVSFLIGRAVISNPSVKLLLNEARINNNFILYFYWGNNSAWIIPLLNKNIFYKIVVRNHRTDLYEDLHDGYIPFKKEIIRRSMIISAISKHGFNYLSTNYPEYKEKIKLNLLGVEFKGLNPVNNSDEYTIVSCSALTPVKRINLLIDVLKLIISLKITWVHIGSGPMQGILLHQAQELPKNINFIFKGQLSNKDVLNLYLNTPIDLFINISQSEGLPVSIMEAMSSGIPVFAANAGGNGELVNNTIGMLFNINIAPKLLAENIEQFLQLSAILKNNYRINAHKSWEEKINAKKNYSEFCELITSL